MKNQLLNQKNKYFAAIYDGVLKHKPIRDIHNDLLRVTVNPNKTVLAYFQKLANRAKKLDKGAGAYYGAGGLEVLAVALVNLFMKRADNYNATVLINSEIRRYESEHKAEILQNAWKQNRLDGKIFYIASKHADSAADHAPYQGKIYVDRYWHNYDTDGRLGKFIKDNNIQTVQWVTGKPVWFITRPNCRHYFVNYTINEVLDGKYHVPNRKIGDKRLQTPAGANLEYYENRLKMLEELYRRYKIPLLKKQIDKTRLLIAKWKKLF